MVVDGYNYSIDLNAAEAEIRSSSTLNDSEKAYAQEKIDQLRWGYAALGVFKAVSAATKYGVTSAYGPVAGMVAGFLLSTAENLAKDYLNDSLAYYAARGQGSYLKWLIDPSGYVYEAVSTNYVENVTVTAYYIPFDENTRRSGKIQRQTNFSYGMPTTTLRTIR